jgi:hypothetical protein
MYTVLFFNRGSKLGTFKYPNGDARLAYNRAARAMGDMGRVTHATVLSPTRSALIQRAADVPRRLAGW